MYIDSFYSLCKYFKWFWPQLSLTWVVVGICMEDNKCHNWHFTLYVCLMTLFAGFVSTPVWACLYKYSGLCWNTKIGNSPLTSRGQRTNEQVSNRKPTKNKFNSEQAIKADNKKNNVLMMPSTIVILLLWFLLLPPMKCQWKSLNEASFEMVHDQYQYNEVLYKVVFSLCTLQYKAGVFRFTHSECHFFSVYRWPEGRGKYVFTDLAGLLGTWCKSYLKALSRTSYCLWIIVPQIKFTKKHFAVETPTFSRPNSISWHTLYSNLICVFLSLSFISCVY